MAEKRNGWSRGEDFLFYLKDGEIIHAAYLHPDGMFFKAQLRHMRGAARPTVCNLRDGFWKVEVQGRLYNYETKEFEVID